MTLTRSDIVLGLTKFVFAVTSVAAVVIMIRVNQYELWKYHAIVMLDAVALACGVFIAVVSRNSVERVLYVVTSLCLIASVFLTISTLGLTQSYMESLPEIIRKLTPGIDA
jgi:uncharacterized protein (DUF779 family)